MQCLHILLTPESVQYGVGFFSTLRLFHGTVTPSSTAKKKYSKYIKKHLKDTYFCFFWLKSKSVHRCIISGTNTQCYCGLYRPVTSQTSWSDSLRRNTSTINQRWFCSFFFLKALKCPKISVIFWRIANTIYIGHFL